VRYGEAIRNGFKIVNRNWQLVLIQMGAMFASFAGFFILVGVPLAVAFIIFGLDLTELSRIQDALRTFREPAEMLSKYFTLVVLILSSLLMYLLVVLAIGLFIFGGSIGVITRILEGSDDKFHMKTFVSEGKRLFFPLVGFTTLAGLIFILVAFVLGLFGGAIAAIVTAAKEQEAALALFLGIFFSLILFVVGFVLILVTLSITMYGAAVLASKKEGAARSLKEAVLYLYNHSDALYFYCTLFIGYFIFSFFVWLLSYPMGYIPFIGSMMALLYHLGVYVLQSYLGLVMLAAVFWYYHSQTVQITGRSRVAASTEPIAETATPPTDISGPPGPGQDESPQGKETLE
jgi:hypothetical protein